MKKFLSILGALTLVASSASAVIACGNVTVTPKSDREKYDDTDKIKALNNDFLFRAKSLVLSDQFQISDNVYWSQIMKYNRNSDYLTNYNLVDLTKLSKSGVKLDGLGGEDSVLVYELVNTIFGLAKDTLANNKDIPDELKNAILPKLGDWNGQATDLLHGISSLIPSIPKLLGDMGLGGMVFFLPLAFNFVTSKLGAEDSAIQNVSQKILNIASDTIAELLESTSFAYDFDGKMDAIIAAGDVETYKDWTYEQVSDGLWLSLLNTIAYISDSTKKTKTYVTNPDLKLELGFKPDDEKYYPEHAKRVVTRFIANLKGETIEAETGEKNESIGLFKYLISTIKLLELKLQFFGDDFFSFVPDASEGASDTGNAHLFAADKDNLTYFKDNIKGKKVETLTNAQNGLNLAFFSKVIRTCLASQDKDGIYTDKTDGVMFQKLLNAVLTDYNASDEFTVPLYSEVFYYWLRKPQPAIAGMLNSVVKQLKGLFDNSRIPKQLPGLIDIIKGFVKRLIPDSSDLKVHIIELMDFLTGTGPETEAFIQSAFTYLWSHDLTNALPTLLTPIRTSLNLDQLNLKNLLYTVKLPLLVAAFDKSKKLDLNKYGDEYLDNPIAGIISKLEADIKIDARQGAELNQDNIQLAALKRFLSILFVENPIQFENIGAKDNYDPHQTKGVNKGLVRQIISNLKQPGIFAALIGLNETKSQDQATGKKITVATNSFLGALLKMLYPSLPDQTSQTEYQMSDLDEVDDSFSANFARGILNLLSSILRGKNYTYLIQPIVADEKAWKVKKIENEYFPESEGILRQQRIVFDFDPTGIKLSDGSVVDDTHKGTYIITALRSNKTDKFTFRRISASDKSSEKKNADKKASEDKKTLKKA